MRHHHFSLALTPLVLALLSAFLALPTRPASASLGVVFGFTCISPRVVEEIAPGGLATCIGAIGNQLDGELISFDSMDVQCLYPDGASDFFDEAAITKGHAETVPQDQRALRLSIVSARASATDELVCIVHTVGRRIELSTQPAFTGSWGVGLAVNSASGAFVAAPLTVRETQRVARLRTPPRCSSRQRQAAAALGITGQLVGRPRPNGTLKVCRLSS